MASRWKINPIPKQGRAANPLMYRGAAHLLRTTRENASKLAEMAWKCVVKRNKIDNLLRFLFDAVHHAG